MDNNFYTMGFEPEPSQNIFAPKITGPNYNEQFNVGAVTIGWEENNPIGATDLDPTKVFYELEYTNNFIGFDSVWISIDKRIPYGTVSYDWKVGKLIKSNNVRIRVRTRSNETEELSDWSISEKFSINVFKLIAPAVLSPIPNASYFNYINIILDDSLLKDTFHQKVFYTFEYMSTKKGIDWTAIFENVAFGKKIFRWNISSLLPSDDYVLRMTVRNSNTCFQSTDDNPDQLTKIFIYGLNIKQPGLFIIDTKPPETLLEIEDRSEVTNQLEQSVSIYSSDETTQVETLRLRECDAQSKLALGDLEDPYDPTGGCDLINGIIEDLNKFGQEKPFSAKVLWKFQDKSGLKKLEAILKDSGGNISVYDKLRTFISIYNQTETINDFIIVLEQRDNIKIDTSSNPPSIIVEPSVFEVVYLGTENGSFFVLEPYSRLLYNIGSESIKQIIDFNSVLYLLTYNSTLDNGYLRKHNGEDSTIIYTFTNSLSIPDNYAIYNNNLYIGLKNGELWKFNGSSINNIESFSSPISKMKADSDYLYISFENEDNIILYNGTIFKTLSL